VIPQISSIVRELILPPQSLFLLVALGFVLRRWWPRFGRRLSAVAILALFLLSTAGVAHLLVKPLEDFAAPIASPYGTGAEAIVVLAAGRLSYAPEYDDTDVPDYVALARLRYAAKLHHDTGLPVLVSGGGGTFSGRRESLATGMARALRGQFGTPVAWIEGRSYNTAENAKFSAKILEKYGVRRIFLVTDAMHMRRSVMAFTENGMEVIAAPTVFFSSNRLTPFHFLPSVEGLRRSHYALYEWIGVAWYWLHYRGAPAIHANEIDARKEPY
jgi:uncharacterized SAM-binding protein YcdF (DUF218 family)